MKQYTARQRAMGVRLLAKHPRKVVAQIMGCTVDTVSRWAHAADVRFKMGRPFTTSGPTLARIVRLKKRKMGTRAIARIMGMDNATVWRALRREGLS